MNYVEDMLLLPADPNATLLFPPSQLSIATFCNREEIVHLLLEAGSALHPDALCAACRLGRVQIVSVLLGAGAETDQGHDRETPLTAAAAGRSDHHVQIVEMLLGAQADLHKTDAKLDTPLTSAVVLGRAEVVHFLLAARADANTMNSEDPKTPLCMSAREGSVQKVRLLLEAAADIERISAGQSPLTCAVESGKAEVVQALIDFGASLDKVDDELYTPLTRALWCSNTDLVHLLLLGRADADMLCPYTGKTPLCIWPLARGALRWSHFCLWLVQTKTRAVRKVPL